MRTCLAELRDCRGLAVAAVFCVEGVSRVSASSLPQTTPPSRTEATKLVMDYWTSQTAEGHGSTKLAIGGH